MWTVLLLVCGMLLSMPHAAHAYLDPGSGSVMLQLLLGGLAGLVVIVKLYWHRLLVFFGMRKEEETQAGEELPPAESEVGKS
jgi:hypothetical protein